MRSVFNLVAARKHRWAAVMVAAALLPATVSPAAEFEAQEPVLRVEQDWELILNEPNDTIYAPQLHTVISPFGHLNSFYGQVTWNYLELPDFEPGGLQIQAWEGNEPRFQRNYHSRNLSTSAETISWTQVLETNGSHLVFRIENGQSTTWGSFGGGNMRVRGSASVPSLNGYDTGVSVRNSQVTYGGNRVQRLEITEVRYYGANGLLSTERTPRVVFEGQ